MSLKRFVIFFLILALAGCSGGVLRQAQDDKRVQDDKRIPVVTTFSTLNSFVQGVGGKYLSVQNLVPVGASPETYQPTPQDIAALTQARVLFENGLGIEAWLQRTIQNAQNPHLRIVVFSDGLPKIGMNPHLWMDPVLARAYVAKVKDALVAIDPAHRSAYEKNARAYDALLTRLQADIEKQITSVSPSRRTMIVFHNAWQYYNNRFGIRTVGVIELSPGQEPNPAYIGHLVDLARQYHVSAVFSEPEYSPKLAQTLAQSAGIRVVSDLYDDSIANNSLVHDYPSMLRYDTGVIVKALK